MFYNPLENEPGTIVAWVPNDDGIPHKWVLCDGKEITKGEWKGRKTPNLMDSFLIGGDAKLFMTVDEDGEAKEDVTYERSLQELKETRRVSATFDTEDQGDHGDGVCVQTKECGRSDIGAGVKKGTFVNTFSVVYIMKIPVGVL